MQQPLKVWLVFSFCSAVMLGVLTWISLTALRLERARTDSQQQAALEENVRLALWRMDSMLSPIIVQESARPHFAYSAFYAAEQIYGRMYNALAKGEVLVPSPLLTHLSSNIVLHFQIRADGRLTSPEVPEGNERDLAEARFTTRPRLEASSARLLEFREILAQPAPGLGFDNGQALRRLPPAPELREMPVTQLVPVINPPLQQQLQTTKQSQLPSANAVKEQVTRNDDELQARAESIRQNYGVNLPAERSPQIVEGLLQPIWFSENLVLARRVIVEKEEFVLGCWLDWANLRRSLLTAVSDLLPDAALEAMPNGLPDPKVRMLASLPIKLLPGALPAGTWIQSASPVTFALAVAWAGLLLAGIATAFLLHGTLSLSERRAAFVSAVTHELRTPLTTFKMYSEMLADDMVPDAQRHHYLQTLTVEANRLSHLVENVLAFAGLERGNARFRVERISLGALIYHAKPRLVQRAEQSSLVLQEDADESARQAVVRADPAAVEQILFNLVDNACKYAATNTAERVIHLEAIAGENQFAILRIRDHGQGISPEGTKRLFRPFSKSADDAAGSAPGVGLGLSLCRRLSRNLGGDLRLVSAVGHGACFELRLPATD